MRFLRRHIVEGLHKLFNPSPPEKSRDALPPAGHVERDQTLRQECGGDLGPLFNGTH